MSTGVSFGISTGVPRRALLASCLLTGALTGCTSSGGAGAGGRAAGPGAAAGLRRRAARASSALLARYDATSAAHPALAGPLAPFRDIVTAHLRALTEADAASAAPDDGVGAGPEGDVPRVPGEPAGAVSALAAAERQAAEERLRTLADAPPELARLLAALAAAGAAQAHLLGEVRA
ncbi:hypothetical protein [Streptomyces marincola]|uniref:hypothetical protein n=1 Tax=Streptomyces marincola TaxID=2878388 RepID=UPI001CF569A6|nr:hypothetical protein [Streptomyces marincola]UCM90789.1 hypothetical protein LC193_24180 [Streptomyces marincola]